MKLKSVVDFFFSPGMVIDVVGSWRATIKNEENSYLIKLGSGI